MVVDLEVEAGVGAGNYLDEIGISNERITNERGKGIEKGRDTMIVMDPQEDMDRIEEDWLLWE